jgi:hypothetical protein
MPGCSGGPVVTNARVYYTTRAAAGASAPGIPHALCYLWAKRISLGRIAPRECEAAFEFVQANGRLKVASKLLAGVRKRNGGSQRECLAE